MIVRKFTPNAGDDREYLIRFELPVGARVLFFSIDPVEVHALVSPTVIRTETYLFHMVGDAFDMKQPGRYVNTVTAASGTQVHFFHTPGNPDE